MHRDQHAEGSSVYAPPGGLTVLSPQRKRGSLCSSSLKGPQLHHKAAWRPACLARDNPRQQESFSFAELDATSMEHGTRTERPNLAATGRPRERRQQSRRCDGTNPGESEGSPRANGAVSSRRLRTLRLGPRETTDVLQLRATHLARAGEPLETQGARRERETGVGSSGGREGVLGERQKESPSRSVAASHRATRTVSPRQSIRPPPQRFEMGLQARLPKTLPAMHACTTERTSRCTMEL